jgi:hypothetical protein
VTNQQLKTLVEERDRIRGMLQSVEAELSRALLDWSAERGFLLKLTAEQALREMERANV